MGNGISKLLEEITDLKWKARAHKTRRNYDRQIFYEKEMNKKCKEFDELTESIVKDKEEK